MKLPQGFRGGAVAAGFLWLSFGVAFKAHHHAAFAASAVVKCEVCSVVQTLFADQAETKLVLVPSLFFFLFGGLRGFGLLHLHYFKCSCVPVVSCCSHCFLSL